MTVTLAEAYPQFLDDLAHNDQLPDGQGVAVVSKVSASTHKLDVYDAAGSGSFETILEAPQLDYV